MSWLCSPAVEYIQAIMSMREEVQHTVMAAIQDVSVGQSEMSAFHVLFLFPHSLS